MEETTAIIPQHKTKIGALESAVLKLSDEVAMIKGLLQIQDCEVKECKCKVIDLTARSMSNNITISGLVGDTMEEKDCKEKVKVFLQDVMDLDFDEKDIEVAHRLGTKITTKPRMMVV